MLFWRNILHTTDGEIPVLEAMFRSQSFRSSCTKLRTYSLLATLRTNLGRSRLLILTTNINQIEHKFMESGHSMMEVDSMHSAIENAEEMVQFTLFKIG